MALAEVAREDTVGSVGVTEFLLAGSAAGVLQALVGSLYFTAERCLSSTRSLPPFTTFPMPFSTRRPWRRSLSLLPFTIKLSNYIIVQHFVVHMAQVGPQPLVVLRASAPVRSPCIKCGLSSNIVARISSDCGAMRESAPSSPQSTVLGES